VAIVAAVMGCGVTGAVGQGRAPVGPGVLQGTIANRKAGEASGLAASRANPGVLWVVNDSENEPLLFAVGPRGEDLGSVRVIGAENRDWEDLAAFVMDGRPYLMIADVGDNNGRRTDVVLYVLADPQMEDRRLPSGADVHWQMRLRFPDGPLDCEAVAVDPDARRVYLISKRTRPPVLFATALNPTRGNEVVTVQPLAELANLEKSHEGLPPTGPLSTLFGSQPTAMDISPDGRQALVLTYRGLWLFQRPANMTWTQALQSTPVFVMLPPLKQAEGACFDTQSAAVFVTSEGRSAPLYRVDLPERP
jgi:hypothetical protein